MSDIRTLGKRLGQRIGKEVIVLGRITEKSASGMNVELTTTDNALINVTLPERLEHNVSGYIEVRGTVKSNSTLSCNKFVCLPPNMTKNFGEQHLPIDFFHKCIGVVPNKGFAADENGYNTAMNMRYAVGEKLDGIFYKE